MRISVQITRRDLVGMIFRIATRMVGNQILFGVAIVFTMNIALTSGKEPTLAILASALMTGVLLGVLAIYANSALVSLLAIIGASLKQGVLGEHVYVISKDGLQEKTSVNDSVYAWSSVSMIVATPHALIVRVRTGYHIIPRRAFPSKQAFEGFCNELSAFRAAA